MENEFILAQALLRGTKVSVVDAARFIRNILDAKCKSSALSDALFCSKIIDIGKRHFRNVEMSPIEAFPLYLKTKLHLRPDSLRDIKYLGSRLIKSNPTFASRNFSELNVADCESWLGEAFATPSQYNKGRAMLFGLFEFALRRQWCESNPIKLIERKKVVEKEIKPLSIEQTERLMSTAQARKNRDCVAAVALLLYAGIRPREVRRLRWRDIDLAENCVTIRSLCSKTGGVRHVEICRPLKTILSRSRPEVCERAVCPPNWPRRWKLIRDSSGFRGVWVQDVLRHTYASYHAKLFRDLPRLQVNMGHRDISLLNSRYVNMSEIAKADAEKFFLNSN